MALNCQLFTVSRKLFIYISAFAVCFFISLLIFSEFSFFKDNQKFKITQKSVILKTNISTDLSDTETTYSLSQIRTAPTRHGINFKNTNDITRSYDQNNTDFGSANSNTTVHGIFYSSVGESTTDAETMLRYFNDLFKHQFETVHKISAEFLANKEIGKEKYNTNGNRLLISPTKNKKDYFNIIQKYKGIRTVNFTTSWLNVTPLLPRNIYKNVKLRDGKYSNEQFTVDTNSLKWIAGAQKDGNVTVTFLHIIQNGRISIYGSVTHENLEINPGGCNPKKPHQRRDEKIEHQNEVFTISHKWGYGFFHFMVENLPRLTSFVKFLQDNPSIYIHVYQNNTFTKNFLQTLGFSEKRIISGTVEANIIYLPAGTWCGHAPLLGTNLLHLQLHNFTQTPKERKSVIVIKRTKRRWFGHHDAIWSMLQDLQHRFDFKLELFPDNPLPNFSDTVAMFHRAVMIVAPHGAGLSNVIISEPGTVVIEGICKNMNLCYSRLAYVLGHVYHAVMPKDDCINTTAVMLKDPIVSSLEWLKKTNQL